MSPGSVATVARRWAGDSPRSGDRSYRRQTVGWGFPTVWRP